jgi:hypothetical protein
MPLHSLINHELRRVTFIWIAPVTADSIQAALENQAAEGAWGYGVLHDTRAVSPQPERATYIAQRVKELSERFGARGPVALVVTAESISSAQKYALGQNREGQEMQVFWDRDEAAHWLAERAELVHMAPQQAAS